MRLFNEKAEMKKVPLRCRVCWVKEKKQCLVPVTNNHAEGPRTIKDAILLCVPKSSIKSDDFICKLCLEQLTPAFQFVALCLETEKLFAQEIDRNSNTPKETQVFDENSHNDESESHWDDLDDSSDELAAQTPKTNQLDKIDRDETVQEVKSQLVDLFDLDLNDLNYISVPIQPSRELEESLVEDGVNVVNLSTNPNKKKRMILLTRNLDSLFRKPAARNLSLYLERKSYSSKSVYSCENCPAKIDEEHRFRTHCIVFHRNSKPFKCPRCGKRFSKTGTLGRHEKYYEGQEKCYFKCTRCKKKFKNKPEMQRHQTDVADAPSCHYIKCNVCSIKFKRQDFKNHCKEHANFLCVKCGKCLPSESSLRKHEQNAHSIPMSKPKNVQEICDKCGKTFQTYLGLRVHIQAAHSGEVYICDKCAKPFRSQKYLSRHYNMKHSTKSPMVFFCNMCNKVCLTKGGFSHHVRFTHPHTGGVAAEHASRVFNCPVCFISFSSESELENHQLNCQQNIDNSSRLQLKSNRACICRICNKVVNRVATLKLHYKGHLGLRENECNICGRRLQSPLSLKRHLMKHAKSNNKYSCNICQITKSSFIELEEHMDQMHLKKIYKCKYCPKKFGLKMLWLSHESTAHEEINAKKRSLLRVLMAKPIYLRDRQYTFPGVKANKAHNIRMDVDEVLQKLESSEGNDGENNQLEAIEGQTNMENEEKYACEILENYDLVEQ